MDAFALVLIAVGVFLMRQAFVGRATDIPQDVTEIIGAMASGTYVDATDVLARQGSSFATPTGSATAAPTDASSDASVPTSGGSNNGRRLLGAAISLGKGKPYVWGATGPNGYDCSGLVWAASKQIGVYTGARFTTSSFNNVALKFCEKVAGPEPGAICNWPGHHMGICTSDGRYFSALNQKLGIVESTLQSEISRRGKPTYWRVK